MFLYISSVLNLLWKNGCVVCSWFLKAKRLSNLYMYWIYTTLYFVSVSLLLSITYYILNSNSFSFFLFLSLSCIFYYIICCPCIILCLYYQGLLSGPELWSTDVFCHLVSSEEPHGRSNKKKKDDIYDSIN